MEDDDDEEVIMASLVAPPHLLHVMQTEADRIWQKTRKLQQQQQHYDNNDNNNNDDNNSIPNKAAVEDIGKELELLLGFVADECVIQRRSAEASRRQRPSSGKDDDNNSQVKETTLQKLQATMMQVVAVTGRQLEQKQPPFGDDNSHVETLVTTLMHVEFYAHLLRAPLSQSQYKLLIAQYMQLSMTMILVGPALSSASCDDDQVDGETTAFEGQPPNVTTTTNNKEEVTRTPTGNPTTTLTDATKNEDDDPGVPADAVVLTLLHNAKYHHGWSDDNNDDHNNNDPQQQLLDHQQLVLARDWFEPLVLDTFLRYSWKYYSDEASSYTGNSSSSSSSNKNANLVASWSFLRSLLQGTTQELGLTQLSSPQRAFQLVVSMIQPAEILSAASGSAGGNDDEQSRDDDDRPIGTFMVHAGEILQWLEPTLVSSSSMDSHNTASVADSRVVETAISHVMENSTRWGGYCERENLWSTLDIILEDLPDEGAREVVTLIWKRALAARDAANQ